jgi:hypothetical protein
MFAFLGLGMLVELKDEPKEKDQTYDTPCAAKDPSEEAGQQLRHGPPEGRDYGDTEDYDQKDRHSDQTEGY